MAKRKKKISPHQCIYLCNKAGEGVGAEIEIRTVHGNELVGTLNFHNNHDWQSLNTVHFCEEEFSWDALRDALTIARRLYPRG